MSMFRRPTDDSSDSDVSSGESEEEEEEEEELDLSNAETDHSNTGTEELIGADLTTAGTLSSGEDISIEHSREDVAVGDIEHVRNMLLASLLEDFYKSRAAELFNTANPGANYHRQSPEIQPLARNLFVQASQAMSSNGLVPASVASAEGQSIRGQYLAGLDNFGLHNINKSDLLSESMKRRISASENALALVRANVPAFPSMPSTSNHPIRDLALRTDRLSIVPHPSNDMYISAMQSPHSHYKSSFQEMRLLGRGGFGRVYQTYNIFDKKEYAVKKIPLSPKLSQQYREKGHAELNSILREVQALAQLDHCNIVRYHATWIEDPSTPFRPPEPPVFKQPFVRQKMIADRPTFSPTLEGRRQSATKLLSYGMSDGIRFEADSADEAADIDAGLQWSNNNSQPRQLESSIPDSDIFTDGMANNARSGKILDDPSCYVLHVQMSMYPATLAHYLSPAPSGSRSNNIIPSRRHCFHLMPAIRILLGILCGIQYIHARGLVHRDIKPSNVFLSMYEVDNYMYSHDGYYDVGNCPTCSISQPCHVNPRIGDFGLVADLARGIDPSASSKSSSSSIVGTEYYRPPAGNEKRSERITDEKLDVYALGIIFVELLWRCGTNMERINLLKNLQKGVVPREVVIATEAEGHAPGLGKSVEECIKGMIEPEHASRWSCSKTKERLEDILTRCCGSPRHAS